MKKKPLSTIVPLIVSDFLATATLAFSRDSHTPPGAPASTAKKEKDLLKNITNAARRSGGIVVICLGLLSTNFNAFAISSGDRVEANSTVNVRQTPAGTSLGQQTSGSLGVVIGGPTTATLNGTSYTWWDINFDTGVDGWVADIGLTAVAPAAPTLISPGNGSSPGTTISASTTFFSWNAVTGANGYGLYVEDVGSGSFVYDNDSVGNVTSINLPSGTLQAGRSYVWNMRASDSAGYSGYSSGSSGRFYFQTQAAVSAPTVSTTQATSITTTSAQMNGTVNPNGADTTVYFQYGLTTAYGNNTGTADFGAAHKLSVVPQL